MNLRIAQLEKLLSRVQRRAQEPRPLPAAASPAALTQELESEVVDPALENVNDSEELLILPESISEDLNVQTAPVSRAGLRADALVAANAGQRDAFYEQPDIADAPETPSSDNLSEPQERMTLSSAPQAGTDSSQSPDVPFISAVPTMEQLGETVSLEEGPAAEFELDAPHLEDELIQPQDVALDSFNISDDEPTELTQEELTSDPLASLSAAGGGNFDESLAAPLDAQKDLDRVILGEVENIPASVSERPVLSTNVVEFIDAAQEFAPKSFAELLESSLEL